ncbi:MAG: DeoR/GlpR family DNA-binding transcription regulator [Lachnospiraceae bacterium]|nr:DeoR/GlpR family DNA-binding transcription regulator [Lachnospiraceae bacterium]
MKEQDKNLLSKERHVEIIEYIKKNGSAHVDELAKKLSVSTMTIRRDLTKLSEDGVIERCFGGAIIKPEVNLIYNSEGGNAEQIKLARKAAWLVKEGNSVFLDAGNTVYEIAKRIKDIPGITCVTNDIRTAKVLNRGSANVIICGGLLQKGTDSVFDAYSLSMLADFRFDVGFFGANAISDNFEILTSTMDRIGFKRSIPEKCRKAYLIATADKFHKNRVGFINTLSDYDGVFTNYQFSDTEQKKLSELKINIMPMEY